MLISIPPEFSLVSRFKNINFYQSKPKIKLLLQKNKIFRLLKGPPPDPQWPTADGGGAPCPPNTALLPTADFWLRA